MPLHPTAAEPLPGKFINRVSIYKWRNKRKILHSVRSVYLYVYVSKHLRNEQQLFPCTTLTGLYNLDRVSSLRGPDSLNNIRLISLPKGLKNESEVYEDNLRRRSTLSPLNVTYAQAVNCCHAGAFCSARARV